MHDGGLGGAVRKPHERRAVKSPDARRRDDLAPLLQVSALIPLVEELQERRHGVEHAHGVHAVRVGEAFGVPAPEDVAVLGDAGVGRRRRRR